MANEEHLAILEQGMDVWNEWRKKNPDIRPDLVGANLSRANLSGALLNEMDFSDTYLGGAVLSGAVLSDTDLSRAVLVDADLSDADLSDADLSDAYLSRAVLVDADLSDADLSRAYLGEVVFSGAYLNGAVLSGAVLSGADLSRAILAYTTIGNVDLSTVKGLETVFHVGPSMISIDTIYRSQGKIPEEFLRGAGVPDSFITYMQSLTGEAIRFYTCFISYSTKDETFAQQLRADLEAKGVRCWFAPEDIAGGKKIHEQIDQAIRLYDKLLVVLSEHSMASEWVKTEIYQARQQEAEENRRKLFPISLVAYDAICQWKAFDADIGKDMAREVREYFIPDFSQWKEHDPYQKAFDRLLRDLKAEA